MDKDTRKYKKALQVLSDNILLYLNQLDEVMARPESRERGEMIAKLANALDVANDSVRYHTLGVNWRKDDKKKAVEKIRERRVL